MKGEGYDNNILGGVATLLGRDLGRPGHSVRSVGSRSVSAFAKQDGTCSTCFTVFARCWSADQRRLLVSIKEIAFAAVVILIVIGLAAVLVLLFRASGVM